jgi:pyruvate dehydrogenase E1 component
VVLARTIKGYGLGESGEAETLPISKKKMNEDELRSFRGRFGIPISDEQIAEAPFYKPPDDSPETLYIREQRQKLGGWIPARTVSAEPGTPVADDLFEEFYKGTDDRKASTTMVFVRLLAKLMRDEEYGKRIVPIIPDESRTFGMESLFSAVGILLPRRSDLRTG